MTLYQVVAMGLNYLGYGVHGMNAWLGTMPACVPGMTAWLGILPGSVPGMTAWLGILPAGVRLLTVAFMA